MREFATFFLLLLLFSSSVSAAEITMNGEVRQGGLVIGKAPGVREVMLDGASLPVRADGTFAFGFGRDHADRAQLVLRYARREEKIDLNVTKRDYQIEYVEGIPQEYVEPPAQTLERIQRESAKKAAARPLATALNGFSQNFIWPTVGRISGIYGSQRVYNGKPGTPHYGVDMAVPVGTPVRAPAEGIVTLAESDFYFEGGVIFIDHGYGVISVLMHLSRVDVNAGQRVSQGEVIARSGASGRASGPHLDWRMYWRDARIDPQLLVPPMP